MKSWQLECFSSPDLTDCGININTIKHSGDVIRATFIWISMSAAFPASAFKTRHPTKETFWHHRCPPQAGYKLISPWSVGLHRGWFDKKKKSYLQRRRWQKNKNYMMDPSLRPTWKEKNVCFSRHFICGVTRVLFIKPDLFPHRIHPTPAVYIQ